KRRQHERRAEDRPDPDTVRRSAAATEQDRDDRDHRLRQGRPDGGENRSDGTLGKLELPSEPLDPVREQFGTEQDDEKGPGEDEDVHGQAPRPIASPTLRAMTARMSAAITAISRSPPRR